jgi:radical SAM protein with 4Fe4S-binding SPASM domain
MNARLKGMNLTKLMIDRVIEQLCVEKIETVNLGGNEPLFTNGPNPKNTMLPYIIENLVGRGILVGLTTSGITLTRLFREHRRVFNMLNDCDVSIDSPFEEEHNLNRGAPIFREALEALRICKEQGVESTCILAAMNWNFSLRHVDALVNLASMYGANVRINPLKPVQANHMKLIPSPEEYYQGFARLMELCDSLDLGEPILAARAGHTAGNRCPCGRTSFRIHSITPDGKIFVSPCVYLHEYKSEYDLLQYSLSEIIDSPQFRVFRQRNANPHAVSGCNDCQYIASCGGGCAGKAYLHNLHINQTRSFSVKDPYCPIDVKESLLIPQVSTVKTEARLVHMDYLCTWIGRPKGMR